jgi:hypothetical protein
VSTGELGSTGILPLSVSTCLGLNSSFCRLCPSLPYPPLPMCHA